MHLQPQGLMHLLACLVCLVCLALLSLLAGRAHNLGYPILRSRWWAKAWPGLGELNGKEDWGISDYYYYHYYYYYYYCCYYYFYYDCYYYHYYHY